MKKLLSLLTLLLTMSSAAWAQTTLLTYTVPESETVTAKAALTAGDGTITPGNAWTTGTDKGWKLDGDPSSSKASSKYVLATLASGQTFKEGDVISIIGYSASNASETSPQGFSLYDGAGGSELVQYGHAINTSASKNTSFTEEFKVESTSSLIGKSTVYIFRYCPSGASKGASSYFQGITITRPSSTPAVTYTVTYKANGGTGDDIVDENASTVAANTFTAPEGKVFNGWNTAADGTGTAYTVGATLSENLTLYAQWAAEEASDTELTAVSDYMWNFSEGTWTNCALGATTESIQNNLGLLSSAKAIEFDSNKKSLDGYSFTQRLKLNGTGSKTSQYVHFKVAGTCKITVYGMSGKSSETRALGITANDIEIKTDFPGDKLYKAEYYYTGDETDVYVYSTNSGINLYGIKVEPQSSAFKLNSAGYGTFSLGADVAVNGVKAYAAKIDGSAIVCTAIADNKVKAGEGVLLYGNGNAAFTLSSVASANALGEENGLKGTTTAEGELVEKGDANYYVLSGDTFKRFTGDAFSANKAYFESATQLARDFRLVFDGEDAETTDIKAIDNGQLAKDNAVYNLNGQRVSQPTRGLYIVNGRKVVIK